MELKDGIPLHKQISDWLKQEISSGALEKNEKLPSENELSDQFDVSRVTVRRALQTLENEQLIYRCQGLGSFVTDQRTHQSFAMLNDFTEELAGSGMQAGSEVISFGPKDIEDQKDILSYLNMDEKHIVTRLERVRLGDGQPVAFDVTWMPVFYGQLLEGFDLSETTIFQVLENEFEIPIKKGCYRIEPTVANDELSSHLDVSVDTPLLLINRISYTVAEKPVYFQQRYYRNDKMVFEIMAERQQNARGEGEATTDRKFMPVFTNS